MGEIGETLREAFEAEVEYTGQTIIVYKHFNTAQVTSFEARGLKNTADKNSRQVVFQFPERLGISVGFVLQIKGGQDYWRVIDTEDFIEDNTFVNFEVSVEKINQEGQRTRPSLSSGNTYNLHGTHARININSQDYSLNISAKSIENAFTDLRQAVFNQVQNNDERNQLISKIDELEEAKGTKTFTEKYRDFMALAANHIEVIAPFVPALSQWLGG